MFDSLDEQIRRDHHAEVSRKERIVETLAIAVLSVILFGGLYLAIRMIE